MIASFPKFRIDDKMISFETISRGYGASLSEPLAPPPSPMAQASLWPKLNGSCWNTTASNAVFSSCVWFLSPIYWKGARNRRRKPKAFSCLKQNSQETTQHNHKLLVFFSRPEVMSVFTNFAWTPCVSNVSWVTLTMWVMVSIAK